MDLERMSLTINIKEKSNELRSEFDISVFQSRVDTCKIAQGVFGNYIIQGLMGLMENYSNFSLACPHKKGFYYAYNLPSFDDSFLPTFFKSQNKAWEVTVTVKGKLTKNSKVFLIGILRIYGMRSWALE